MKNKLLKILAPTLLGATTLIPVCTMTSCNNKKDTGVTVTSSDSYGVYTFELENAHAGEIVRVNITNASAQQEQVKLYNFDGSTGAEMSYYVKEDGKTLKVGVGYPLAPSRSANSSFSLKFSYESSNEQKEVNVDNLHFNYVIDYGAELKDGNYPKTPAKDAAYWTQGFKVQYKEDILKDNNIFQNDARYTTADRISKSSHFTNLESFKAFFNDIVSEGQGLHVHMNYQIKGTKTDSKFQFDQTGSNTTFEFTNFDFTFSFESKNGYELQMTAPTNAGEHSTFYVVDPQKKYALDGRFQGKFTYRTKVIGGSDWTEPKTIEYNSDLNDAFPESTSKNDWTEKQVSCLLALGVIQETYGFTWGASETKLTMYSTYAANATND